MSCEIVVKRAEPEQYAELMQVLDTSFSFFEEGAKFIHLLPKLYKTEYKPWDNNICVFEDGKIAAAVGLYYSEYTVCGKTLKYGGIGNVGVLPDKRGLGYMKLAMQAAIDEMKQNGTSFCVLDGQRQRYQYFGFDNIGSRYAFHLTRRNLHHVYGDDRQSALSAEPITAEDADILDQICRINEEKPIHALRKREELFDLLCSWFATPYKLMNDGKMIGYFVLNDDRNDVSEIYVVSPEWLDDAVLSVMQTTDANSVRFHIAVTDPVYCAFFHRISDWMEHEGSCKISVFDYKETLATFLAARALQNEIPDQSFSCLIHGVAGDENLMITIKDGKASVEEYGSEAEIELAHLEAASFFFDRYSAKRTELKYSGCGVLPLPFCLMSPDHV